MPAIEELKLHSSGKVREIYEAGEQELIMVASDRISAFDVVLPEPIPDKGKVLTQMSIFWFETTGDIVPNHFIDEDVPSEVAGRAIRCKRLEMYPVECVVRGYITGSGWKEYKESGSVCGIELPSGLQESDQLPEPIFTPATKAEIGEHDENVSFERAAEIVGSRDLMEELRRVSINLYEHARTHAAGRGIILADTKFEFGASPGAEVVLGDEVLTPDSSRFWPADEYEPGRGQASFDKQFVRDYLSEQDWNKEPPAPPSPRSSRGRRPATARPTSGSPAASSTRPGRSMEKGTSRARIEPTAEDRFVLLRPAVGVTSFGINEIVLEPGQRGRIHLHHEQEEVFLVLEGVLTIGVDGVEETLEKSELIRVGPGVRRQLVNRGPERLILLALGGAGEHQSRDAEAFESWDQAEGASPRDVPLPEDLPLG